MELIQNIDQARRVARAVVSDVALYNKAKVEEGIRHDDVFERLRDELEEGRQHFLSRVSPDLAPEHIYELALVDVLIKRAGRIESDIW